MKYGRVSLDRIYGFKKKFRTVPCGSDGEIWVKYSGLCTNLTEEIPETSGWYFWFDKNHELIYIGKAEKTTKGNSLRVRIRDELKKERLCFWTDKNSIKHQSKVFGGKFDGGVERTLRKKGVRYILWISHPGATQYEIRVLEHLLIGRYGPKANIQNADSRLYRKLNEITKIIDDKTR